MDKGKQLGLIVGLALALSLIFCSATALAGEGDSFFYLLVETVDQVVVPPERVAYSPEQTIAQALSASGHTFEGLEEDWVVSVDGVSGSYVRSDQDGRYDLHALASTVTVLRFSEQPAGGSGQPSSALCGLVMAMADYLIAPADVQSAAATAYEAALAALPSIDEAAANRQTQSLSDAIAAYRQNQAQAYAIAFCDEKGIVYTPAQYSGVQILAVSEYGKEFRDEDGDGSLQLPAGEYEITLRRDWAGFCGALTVTGAAEIRCSLPEGEWLNSETLAVSGDYGENFAASAFAVSTAGEHCLLARISDRFHGGIYAYLEPSQTLPGGSLCALYVDSRGEDCKVTLPFSSRTTPTPRVLASGGKGNTVAYRISAAADGNGFRQFQEYRLELQRVPSLSALTLTDQEGTPLAADQAFAYDAFTYTYRVVNNIQSVFLTATAFAADCQITINGEQVTSGQSVGVPMEMLEGSPVTTAVTIQVGAGAASATYTLSIVPGAGQSVTFRTTDRQLSLQVTNVNGEVLGKSTKLDAGRVLYIYTLVPGETYYYVASRDGCYYATRRFTLEESVGATIDVNVKTDDGLADLAFGSGTEAANKGGYLLDQAFSPECHRYTLTVPDSDASIYAWLKRAEGSSAGVKANYTKISSSASVNGILNSQTVPTGKTTGTMLPNATIGQSAYGNTLTFRLSQTDASDDVTYYQDYVVEIKRSLSLAGLEVVYNGETQALQQIGAEGGVVLGYNKKVLEYTLVVPAAATSLTVKPTLYSGAGYRYGDESKGYQVQVNGQTPTGDGFVVALNGSAEAEQVRVVVTNSYDQTLVTTYTLQIEKAAPLQVDFVLQPTEGLLSLTEQLSGNRVWPEQSGVFGLSESFVYEYTLTLNGYVGRRGTLALTTEGTVVLDGDVEQPILSLDGRVTVPLSLTQAAVNETIDPNLGAEWPDFRCGQANNAVVSVKSPVVAADSTLYWAQGIGRGYDANAVSSPILVDGDLIVYSGARLLRVDAVSGAVVAEGNMADRSSYAITPPVYAQGMLFVALSDGRIQAFDAKTLQSLWLYRDPLGGQPNTPLTIHNGYLYTGFWVGETAFANFVCLPVADEDPLQSQEEKIPAWTYAHAGGFYWAGAFVCDNFLLVGTDDGQNGYRTASSSLLLLHPLTGRLLDRADGLNSDIRSTISYDSVTDAYYFTSKGGSFYSVQVRQQEGAWKLTALRSLALHNGSDSTPMSTSTPVVYHGRAYIGVSGASQFVPYSGHNITVVDLSDWRIAYSAPTQGYPQTSGLLTTAYAQSGFTYVYFCDNYTPGKIRVLRDKSGQTGADYVTVENYREGAADKSISAPYVLFTPVGDQAQYAICSPIADSYGTIYFKNDSGNLMALGSRIEKIEVTTPPKQTGYYGGDCFDPTGMIVTLTYCNGLTRDVTKYVTWPKLPLTEGQTSITLSFPHVMYHNEDASGVSTAGVRTATPTTQIPINVGPPQAPVEYSVSVEGLQSNGTTHTVKLSLRAVAACQVVAAVYAPDGRLLGLGITQVGASATAATVELNVPAALPQSCTVKAFLLDQTLGPLADAAVYPIP